MVNALLMRQLSYSASEATLTNMDEFMNPLRKDHTTTKSVHISWDVLHMLYWIDFVILCSNISCGLGCQIFLYLCKIHLLLFHPSWVKYYYGMTLLHVFNQSESLLCSIFLIFVLYAILCHIRPCYYQIPWYMIQAHTALIPPYAVMVPMTACKHAITFYGITIGISSPRYHMPLLNYELGTI